MASNVYSTKAVVEFIQELYSSNTLEDIKVGKINELYFNDMEGYNYNVSLTIVTPEKYRNRRLTMRINSTYLQEWETSVDDYEERLENEDYPDTKEIIQSYMNNLAI